LNEEKNLKIANTCLKACMHIMHLAGTIIAIGLNRRKVGEKIVFVVTEMITISVDNPMGSNATCIVTS